jgi:hypothetical protein
MIRIINALAFKNVGWSTSKEIAKIFDLKVKHITSGCRKLFEVMDYNIYDCIQSSKPEDFIDRFKGKLKLGEYADLAKKIIRNIIFRFFIGSLVEKILLKDMANKKIVQILATCIILPGNLKLCKKGTSL